MKTRRKPSSLGLPSQDLKLISNQENNITGGQVIPFSMRRVFTQVSYILFLFFIQGVSVSCSARAHSILLLADEAHVNPKIVQTVLFLAGTSLPVFCAFESTQSPVSHDAQTNHSPLLSFVD